ncbi:MAG: rhomboid family intramembrane serine protease [Saprospiraceae bacterium]
MITRLVIVNVAIFLSLQLLRLILMASNGGILSASFHEILSFLSLSSDWKFLLTHPWVLVTAHFIHIGFWHLLFNMLNLYWFGRIVGDFIGNHRILPLYFLGGFAGALLFFASSQVLPFASGGTVIAYGASAAVMAMVTAAGTISPDYSMRLLILGPVKLKYIVLALLVLDFVGIANDQNTGGHFGHLGGAILGWLYVWNLRQGRDLAKPFTSLYLSLRTGLSARKQEKARPMPRLVYKKTMGKTDERWYESEAEEADFEGQLDIILDKIKASGYESLNQKEKDFLQEASKK